MATPNGTLRAARLGLGLSQDEMADRLREAGATTVTKRTVQRWESGFVSWPQPLYARALEAVMGRPPTALGFAMPVPNGGGAAELPAATPAAGSFTGVWLSRYEYPSSSRGATHVGQHYVVLVQVNGHVSVQSIGSPSTLTMDLHVDGATLTGTWGEVTEPDGYYKGARYHGAIQLLADPSGRRLEGQWVGFGRDREINNGPWTLTFVDADTGRGTLERYGVPPPA